MGDATEPIATLAVINSVAVTLIELLLCAESPSWNGVVRYYHRSGAFGLFEPNADEGSTLGFGLQYRF